MIVKKIKVEYANKLNQLMELDVEWKHKLSTVLVG